MQYSKIINGVEVVFDGVLKLDDTQVINPSHEQLISAGWKEYVPPVVEHTIEQPDEHVVIEKMKTIVAEQFVKQMPDNEALLYKEMFPTWASMIGKNVLIGDRFYHNDKLYKVLQAHTVQEHWKPSIDTASLYVEIVDATLNPVIGTIDNPIKFELNMELMEGYYYIDGGVIYRCTRTLAACYWNLKEIIGQYVEVE